MFNDKKVWAVVLLMSTSFASIASDKSRTCPSPGRALEFSTSKTSALNLSISPDGRTLVFDVLGDLYTVPVEGGRATRVTSGPARDIRPVWSPNGKMIAFISDRDGITESPYILKLDRDMTIRRLAPGASSVAGGDGTTDLTHMEWMPGSKLMVLHNFMGYQVEINESGEDVATEIDGSRFDRYYGSGDDLYRFARHKESDSLLGELVGSGDEHDAIWRYSQDSAKSQQLHEHITSGYGEPPALSRDGRWIVYRDVRPVEGAILEPHQTGGFQSTLRVYDRVTKQDRVLVSVRTSDIWQDDGKEYGVSGVRRIAISPDSKSVFISYGGQIHRIDLTSGRDVIVPVTVDIEQCLAPFIHQKFGIGNGLIQVMNTRSATMSPDRRKLVFNALRQLYVVDLPGVKPRLLTPSTDGQFHPAFSPDGRWIAFVSWNEVEGGHVWRVPIAGGLPEKLTAAPGFYGPPEWSSDGSMLAFAGSADLSEERPGFQVNEYEGTLHIRKLSATADENLPIKARVGDPVTFSEDGTRIFYRPYRMSDELAIASIGVDGTDNRDETIKGAHSYYAATYAAVAPAGNRIAAIDKNELWIYDCSGVKIRTAETCRRIKVTKAGAYDPRWRDGGRILEWSYGRGYYRAETERLIAATQQSDDGTHLSGASSGIQEFQIDLKVPRGRASGVVALKGARIIPMTGDAVIENGTIVVRDGRIERVGTEEQVKIPTDAFVIELGGKTIMPGIIDSHAHAYLARDLLPTNHWELLANLAYGVTTIKDPSNGGHHGFQYGEMTEAGISVGPRVYGATGLVRGVADIDSYQDALSAVLGMKRLGGTFVKYHTGYSRQQRQWLFEAARSEGLNVVSHYPTNNGIGQFNLTVIADGATTAEHAISESEDLYDDIRTLLVRSGVGVSYAEAPSLGGRYHHAYWNSTTRDPRAIAFLRLDGPKTRWDDSQLPVQGLAPLYPTAERYGAFLAKADRDGARVLAGSHGNFDGVGMHWSIWAHVRAGMSELRALHTATINGAWGLGLEDEVGSIEVGKLADLLILERNPLDDIRNTLSLKSVMKDGVLRDSETLNELWPVAAPLPAWEYKPSRASSIH